MDPGVVGRLPRVEEKALRPRGRGENRALERDERAPAGKEALQSRFLRGKAHVGRVAEIRARQLIEGKHGIESVGAPPHLAREGGRASVAREGANRHLLDEEGHVGDRARRREEPDVVPSPGKMARDGDAIALLAAHDCEIDGRKADFHAPETSRPAIAPLCAAELGGEPRTEYPGGVTPRAIRILGIDPGLRRTGWGLVEAEGNRLAFIACGSVETESTDALPRRLAAIHAGLSRVVREWQPQEAAIETTFVNRDAVATLKLGQARGVALLVPAQAGLIVAEYAPNLIKKTIVGAGHAEKAQIRMMLGVLLPRADPTSEDAADALAIALTHAQHRTSAVLRAKAALAQ